MKFCVRDIKFYCFIVLTMVVFSANVYAQPKQPPSAKEMVERMKKELNLTDEQVSQITPVIEEEMNTMRSVMGEPKGGDKESGRSQMEAIHQETETKLAQYLTKDQLNSWKSKRQGPPRGRSGANDGSGASNEGPGGPGGESGFSNSGSGNMDRPPEQSGSSEESKPSMKDVSAGKSSEDSSAVLVN
ncbi:MAG TPA: hypothetical protein PKY78_03700 [Candidatus Omnitrophota bacterium]|nr:hypothetical protein [Candidatus Omnitrophota bacterium]HPS20073.1 hypothetical protein [Candidatus Omnitrophota bacterium]